MPSREHVTIAALPVDPCIGAPLRVTFLLPFCALTSLAAAQHARAPAEHWSYRPVVRPAPPALADATWCRSPLDHFVLAAMQAQALRPSPPVDRALWLRRVSFDLTGLPPSPAEVTTFVSLWKAASSPEIRDEVYRTLVERLLASPHFGERWGRHWLDMARYADSNCFLGDGVRPNLQVSRLGD